MHFQLLSFQVHIEAQKLTLTYFMIAQSTSLNDD